jgi:ABC-type multidrug transport system fused ATPase/permease subunit
MNESYSFGPMKEELERRKSAKEVGPVTAESHEKTDPGPMTLKDHWLSLRQSVQEKVVPSQTTEGDIEQIRLMSELITPDLMTGYRDILRIFNAKARKTEDHPEREFIDIESEDIAEEIEHWIESLVREVGGNAKTGLDESDMDEIRARCWFLFGAHGNVMNTNSLEKDISESLDGKEGDMTADETAELVGRLQKRYPLEIDEIQILVDLARAEKGGDSEYSMKLLVETVSRLWGEYGLNEKKGKIAKISLGYLMSKGAESFAPSLFQGMIANDRFDVAVFLEYFGLDKFSDIVNSKNEIELAKVMNDISHKINERITDSLFFHEFEFIHEKSLGEVYAVLERGKTSTQQILQETISQFAPMLTGIAMSLAFLAKINPVLGAIGVGSLPVMYTIAKKQNAEIWPMYEKERHEGEKIATRLDSIKGGFEEVKTSSEVPVIAERVREQMNVKDTLSLHRFVEETKMRLQRMIPFDVSTIVAAGVGGALQEAGMISGGAILSNIIYSEQLNRPVRELVNLYFNKFSRYVQDIQRMDEILGRYEELDLPEGEREKDRVPVSEMKSFDISIRDLRYKGILQGVNLDVKQGEFVTIAGASGVGKSTLLRNLVGLYRPDGGEIEIGGVRNDQVKRYGRESLYSVMSYCNQSPQIFEGMTLRENLTLWSKSDVDDEAIRKVMVDLRLEKFFDRLDEEVKHLSGGEKVRLGVARTLIKGAKIMLLDEPTASLDSQAATETRKMLSEIGEKYPDTTIICVSHDEELIKASRRVVRMEDLQ